MRWGLLLTSLGLSACAHRAPEAGAPLVVVVVARTIRTMDPLHPVAQALAMREGRLLAVGTRAEVMAHAGKGALVEEFPSSTIVPGLVDVHGHLAALGDAPDLVANRTTPPSPEEHRRRLSRVLETCARLGLTGVHAGVDLETFRVLQEWDLLGVLPIRVHAMAQGQGANAEEILDMGPFRGHQIELRTVEFLVDEVQGGRGAALIEPYSDAPSQPGLLRLDPSDFEARVRRFSQAGFQVALHAIGDRANALALDVLSKLEAERPGSRGLLDTSARAAFGGDFPVEVPNPLWSISAARAQKDPVDQPLSGGMPDRRVTAEEPLAGFTTGPAWASFSDEHAGRLIAGFDADFVVLPVDPVTDDPRALLDAQVELTVVQGVDVYRADRRH